MREHFAAWYRPSPEQRREFITTGLVVLDANVLLDLYRMNADAREDVLGLLWRLGDRLWVPHQAALEFHRNRFGVIHDQEQILQKLRQVVTDSAAKLSETVNNIRDHPIINREALASVIKSSYSEINAYIDKLTSEPILSIKMAIDSDPILDAVTALLSGKVGDSFTGKELAKVEADGAQRLKEHRPPGYADAKKEGKGALGDYILWRQILDEASKRQLPVLLVTNDQKEDWYLRVRGITVGPQTSLIAEMLDEANVPFHAQTLARFVSSASAVLESAVKATTVSEVSRLDEAKRVEPEPDLADSPHEQLSPYDRLLIEEAVLTGKLRTAIASTPGHTGDDPTSFIRALNAQLELTRARLADIEERRRVESQKLAP